MGRPSPRTQGCEEFDEDGNCIKPFQKFGTQQLKFVGDEPPKLSTTYQGVKQVDVGKSWKGITTSGYSGTKTTLFSERFQKGITGATPTSMREEAIQRLQRSLSEFVIEGITTTIDLHKKILSHKKFINSDFDVNWLVKENHFSRQWL